jgi:hypothetical protein
MLVQKEHLAHGKDDVQRFAKKECFNASAGNWMVVRMRRLINFGGRTYSNPGLAELSHDGNG